MVAVVVPRQHETSAHHIYDSRKRILVTGGAGFLGSHLIDRLLRRDPKQRRPNIAQAKAQLDWEPNVPLEEGLARTVAYFRDLLPELEAA